MNTVIKGIRELASGLIDPHNRNFHTDPLVIKRFQAIVDECDKFLKEECPDCGGNGWNCLVCGGLGAVPAKTQLTEKHEEDKT